MNYSGEPEIRKKSSMTYAKPIANPTYLNQANMFQTAQPQQQQQHQQQFINYNDSGIYGNYNYNEQNENTMYGDMTVINNNRIYNQQHQQNKTAFGAMSNLTSPQKMSTPINMRTKDMFGGTFKSKFRCF
jgi:hypothetical protein